ncbi:GGDEF family protein [Hyphomicrobiales bacterium]|nr:GGDEF family protein [Hyphomicrobiales bacterium]CAH1700478.1 GGDEF family protein [Hyphomicrobiales bacterium]CAI0343641.1 GGDEF family protein [Hyphomicrobiales bacterium]
MTSIHSTVPLAAAIDDEHMFDLAPVSLWLEDYSAMLALFAEWRRQGVNNLRSFLEADIERVKACSACIRLLKVNQRTLALYGASDTEHLMANLGRVFRADMLKSHVDELVQLWEGKLAFSSRIVNYSLSGERLDVQIAVRILPGHETSWDRVLVAIDDVTEREEAQRKLVASEAYARGLFDHSPTSLWVEDFRYVKRLLDELREQGIEDLRVFTEVHPEFIDRCMHEIRVIDVNRHTLEMFAARDKAHLLTNLDGIFRDEMRGPFREQLIDLWNGKIFQQREVVNYKLDGTLVYLHLQFSVLPGHEQDWSLVQVALTDITARRKAEAYLEFLGKHDVLTKLYNRAFYVDELNRIERRRMQPVSLLLLDLNGLKSVNDEFGHGAGDELLRRAGEVLAKAVDKPLFAARIGGDEFALVLPGAGPGEAALVLANVRQLIELNNQFHGDSALSLSLGMATSEPGEAMEALAKRADRLMYEDKRNYYATIQQDRRLPKSPADL